MDYNLNREADSIIRTLESLANLKGEVTYKDGTFDTAQKMSYAASFFWSPSPESLKEGLSSLKAKIETLSNHVSSMNPNDSAEFLKKMEEVNNSFNLANKNLQSNIIPIYYGQEKQKLQKHSNELVTSFVKSIMLLKKRTYKPLSKKRVALPKQQSQTFSEKELNAFVEKIIVFTKGINSNGNEDVDLLKNLDDFIHENIEMIMASVNGTGDPVGKDGYRREKIAEFALSIQNNFNDNPDANLLARELNSYITSAFLTQNDMVKEVFSYVVANKKSSDDPGIQKKGLNHVAAVSKSFKQNVIAELKNDFIKINPKAFKYIHDVFQYIRDQKLTKINMMDVFSFYSNSFIFNEKITVSIINEQIAELVEKKYIKGLAINSGAINNWSKMELLTDLIILEASNREIIAIANSCPHLKSINLSESEDLTVESIEVLGELCTHLETLEIPRCRIPAEVVPLISNKTFPNLRSLNLTNVLILEENLLKIALALPLIENLTIGLSEYHSLHEILKQEILKFIPNLKILNLSNVYLTRHVLDYIARKNPQLKIIYPEHFR